MTMRVAIMGFGRMGRNVFRAIYPRTDMEVVAINDLADPAAMEYLLRFDSLQESFPEPVRVVDGMLYARGKQIPITHHKAPGEAPWYDHGVDVVVEATGRYRTQAELQRHLDAGADRVILTTPPLDAIDGTYICGVTDPASLRNHRTVYCGSSTANCVALMLKTLDDAFGVQSASFTSVHAYTSEQSLIDTYHGDLRLSRAAMENIVPVSTNTVRLVETVLPHLRGKVGGYKLHVPVSDVSCADLVTSHKRAIAPGEINEVFRSAAASVSRHLLDFTDDPIVSSDVAGSTASCTFDSLATMVVEADMAKTIGWYEQGGGLAHRIVEAIAAFRVRAEQGGAA